MGTTVKVEGSMVILVLLFGLVSCESGVTSAVTTTSVTTTPEDSNVTCCDTVKLSSTDDAFQNALIGTDGTYSLYTNNPSFNDRKVYKLDKEDLLPTCLYWACSAWRINLCSTGITEEYQCSPSVVYSSETSKKCVHGGDLVWTLYDYLDSTVRKDPTMKISCNTDSPTSTTTTPAPGTTTPTTLTYCGSDGIPALNTVTRKRRVGSGLECQEYCAGIQGAEYFKWKKTGAKVCWCLKLGVKPRDNFVGGPVIC